MSLNIKLAFDNKDGIKQLFDEYTNLLINLESSFEDYLYMQNYEDELDSITDIYGLPEGRLYIAYFDNNVAGCIGLKKLNDNECEMKRLYVRPQFGGKRIGEILVDTIIADARLIGYKAILLDTFHSLDKAIRLYERKGFYRIPAYNNSPIKNTVFMKMDLL